jgi:hypothetical protein
MGAQLQSFDAGDLWILRAGGGSPVGKMLAERDNIAAGRLVAQYETMLAQHAADVLAGDFTIFEELDRIVKTRARDMR